MAFEIKTITAYVAVDKDGEEGIIATRMGEVWMPLVCADEKRVASMYNAAKQICAIDNKEFKVLRFAVREDVTDETKAKYEKSST
jgi:hypothetical protein